MKKKKIPIETHTTTTTSTPPSQQTLNTSGAGHKRVPPARKPSCTASKPVGRKRSDGKEGRKDGRMEGSGRVVGGRGVKI